VFQEAILLIRNRWQVLSTIRFFKEKLSTDRLENIFLFSLFCTKIRGGLWAANLFEWSMCQSQQSHRADSETVLVKSPQVLWYYEAT